MPDEAIILNGRYQLIERVGSGGMAVVYKAQDRALGRIVAIKMLQESMTSDEGFLRRFQREAHAAANLTHPNIVTVHDIGQDGHRHYIVMEYVDGHTLKQLIRQYGENGRFMPINRSLDLTVQICNGIGYAHRANLVHCDVKPQNILVTRDEQVKVTDFGIARAMSQATQQQVSQVWGTPQYFAPEQAAGEPPTPASDVYAIGIMMFEMLSNRLPFQADSQTALALKHLQEPPPLVTIYNPTVPKQLEQIINKLLAKEPSGRYRTAGQLGRILSTYRLSHTIHPFPAFHPPPCLARQPGHRLDGRHPWPSGSACPLRLNPSLVYGLPGVDGMT
jgi:serine/threonine-protein kinase